MTKTGNTLRVEIAMTLDIDVDAWAEEYGIEPGKVAGDVEEHATNTVVAHLSDLGVLAR